MTHRTTGSATRLRHWLLGIHCQDCHDYAQGCYVLPAEFGTTQVDLCQRHLTIRMAQIMGTPWGIKEEIKPQTYYWRRLYGWKERSVWSRLGRFLRED